MLRCILALATVAVVMLNATAQAEPALKALIVDGQNNHGNWPQTTKMMKKYLEDTKLFSVDVATTAKSGTDESFKPDFGKYNVVVSNYNGAPWPKETQEKFLDFVKGGGGFVVVHAANNAFGNWKEYNEIIGLGGWDGRNEKSGPYVYLDDEWQSWSATRPRGAAAITARSIRFSSSSATPTIPSPRACRGPGCTSTTNSTTCLRGPGENMHVLATAYADKAKGGSGRHEPMIFTVEYGKGRVFHTPMGHGNDSQECVGFITTLTRGAEWAATGKVTQPIPSDFPTEDKTSQRKFGE